MPNRRAVALLLALLCALTVVGCGTDSGDTDQSPHRRVQTALGPVDVPVHPKRIVVLWKPTLAAVTQLGFHPIGTAADTTNPGDANGPARELVPYLPRGYDASKLEVVSTDGSSDEIDPEKIIALRPDLVIGAATNNKRQAEIKSKVERFVPVALLPWRGNSSWREHLTEVARVLGAQAGAERIVGDYESRIRQAKSVLPKRGVQAVSMVRIQQPGQYRLETPESFSGQVVADLGLSQPPATRRPDAGKDYRSLFGENLNTADADTVFALPNTSKQGSLQWLTSNPLWPELSAVRAGRAFQVDYDFWGAATYFGAQQIISDVIDAYSGKLAPL